MEHEVVAFWEQGYELQTGFTESRAENGDLVVTGPCPRCKGETSFAFSTGRPGLAEVKEKAVIYCACGYPHDKRPPESDESGCGAYWSVEV